MFYERKKYDEKKAIEENSENIKSSKIDSNKDDGTKKTEQGQSLKKEEEVQKELCPICGKELKGEKQKEFKSQEEYKKIQSEMSEAQYNKIVAVTPQNSEIICKIEENLKKEFSLEGKLSGFNQAHHLLSRNDIFFKYSDFARMAISAGYNINCVENGIILPTISNLYIKNWVEGDKYRVMKATGMQLHCGQHQYRIEESNRLPKDILRRFPKRSYSDIVTEKFEELVKKYIPDNSYIKIVKNMVCSCSLSENDKKKIIEDLNKFSNDLREDLNKFKSNPQECELYVSTAAIEYAFGVFENIYEVIKIKEITDKIVEAVRFKIVENLKKGDIKIVESEEFCGKKDIKFIKFCRDIELFIFEGKLFYCYDDLEFLQNKNSIEINFNEYSLKKEEIKKISTFSNKMKNKSFLEKLRNDCEEILDKVSSFGETQIKRSNIREIISKRIEKLI